ncbi:cysteine-rich motor neuron 1 protein-like [Periplaneta americana]|uniref:cysteine-rich motor neuron 1 protein-like n=1 Tax=Periplaneta americana TaxID=6978 RepID=UPI0037E8EB5D
MAYASRFALADGISSCNGTSGECEGLLSDDEAPCPPDSVSSDPSVPGSACVCAPARCVQPVCRFGTTRQLRRTGTNSPGNCCDVYECEQPREKNCSDVVCPNDGVGCPTDSYRLPNLRAPGDCCSHPQGCECLPGSCPEPDCDEGEHARKVRPGNRKPGTCCPLFECVSNNDQVTNCMETECPELPASCRETRVPQGKCCPECVVADPVRENSLSHPGGCVSSSGKIQQNGEVWQEDPCTNCTCLAGETKCQAYMCDLRCDHPHYVPDECCPICDGISVVTIPPHCPALNNCSLRCVHGFMRDNDGCYTCHCQAEECVLECPGGFLQDNHGNKLCKCANSNAGPNDCPPLTGCRKNCSHGYRLKGGCEVCKCKECRPLTDCNKNCVHGLRNNDRGCPICKCRASTEHTSDITATNHISRDTICISADEQHHDDGEAWFDGCRQCYCHGGVEMCNLITCPVPACKSPVFNQTHDCCPHCPETGDKELRTKYQQHPMVCHSVDGVYRVEGETWSLDSCTRCLCHMGRVLCETHHCPPAACTKPVHQPGQCCRQCPKPEPLHSSELAKPCGAHYLHGNTWMEDACRSCSCTNGNVECFTQECPAVSCDRPVLVKNQCCPMCLAHSSPKVCIVGNTTYHQGEEWHEDACTRCECIDGQKMCTEKVCSVSCTKPIKKPGKCCPICPDTESNHADAVPPADVSFKESTYIIVILVLVCVIICLGLYLGLQCCRHRQQLKLNGPNPAYHGYAHRDSYPPPHYMSGDRHRSRLDPYQYKQISDLVKSTSIGATEKSTLASV